MANKKINELDSRASLSLSDLMAVGDPSTGYLYKTTISDLKTLTGAGVISFNGRFGSVVPVEGDYALTQLSDVIITSATNAQVLQYNGSNWVNASLAANVDTLDIVTGRGNTTANSITVGSVSAAGLSNLLGQLRTFATTGNVYIGANPSTATDAGYKLDVNGTIRATSTFYGTQILTGAHSFRNETYITATTDGYTKQNGYNGTNAYTMGFIGDLRFAPSTTVKAVFSFNGSYSNNGTIYSGDSSLVKIFTGDAMGNTIGSTNINGYGINLMPTLNYTTGTSNFTGIYYNPTLTATTGLTHYAMNLVAGSVKMGTLAGTGTRLVVTDANGVLSAQTIPSLSGYVPYTGATANLDLGSYTLTAGSIIKTGGTSSQFLKADGSIDSNTYLTSGSSGVFVPYTGATADVTLGNRQLYAKNVIVQPTGFPILAVLGSDTTGSGYGVMTLTNGATGYFKTNTLVVDRIYTFPDATGTVALTSDLSGYLPLAGGILTGALTGTTATFSSSGTQILTLDSTSNYTQIFFQNNGTLKGKVYYNNADNQMTFGVYNTGGGIKFEVDNNVTAATISSTGVATFSSRLTAGGAVAISDALLPIQINAVATTGQAYFASNNNGGYGLLVGYDNANGYARIRNISNTALTFETNNTERMRITSGGLMGLGTTNVQDARLTINYSGGVDWAVGPKSGTSAFVINASSGGVYVVNGGTSWNAWSDKRLKKNIENLNYGLNEILSINAVRFNYLTDKDNNSNRLGFIAQNVQEYIPEIVNCAYDDMLGLSTTDLVPVLAKSIQEIVARYDTKIQELKAEIETLKA